MFQPISAAIRQHLATFPSDDQIIFNNRTIRIEPAHFQPLSPLPSTAAPTIAFLDGGQAEIINGGNFALSFIRLAAQLFQGEKRVKLVKNEFYLFTKAVWKEAAKKGTGERDDGLFYESSIFPLQPEKLIEEADLTISSYDSSLRTGNERAPIARVASMARRLAELALAAKIKADGKADFILLDGTLEAIFTNEEKYLAKLPATVSALAKTSSLFTTSGNNPAILLNKIAPAGCWQYILDHKTAFVKFHLQAKHVFRFEGASELLPLLIENSADALFLGYPYGLILADQLARVSNAERNALRMNFLLRRENKEIVEYLNASNAHEILDELG